MAGFLFKIATVTSKVCLHLDKFESNCGKTIYVKSSFSPALFSMDGGIRYSELLTSIVFKDKKTSGPSLIQRWFSSGRPVVWVCHCCDHITEYEPYSLESPVL